MTNYLPLEKLTQPYPELYKFEDETRDQRNKSSNFDITIFLLKGMVGLGMFIIPHLTKDVGWLGISIMYPLVGGVFIFLISLAITAGIGIGYNGSRWVFLMTLFVKILWIFSEDLVLESCMKSFLVKDGDGLRIGHSQLWLLQLVFPISMLRVSYPFKHQSLTSLVELLFKILCTSGIEQVCDLSRMEWAQWIGIFFLFTVPLCLV